ncbi:MAG: GldG family protein [Bacteriovoracaceae bacterium]|nr:GldG family protein [Bacteriovoracaceae bacterium]
MIYKKSSFFDLTKENRNSLSEQTKAVLNSMPAELKLTYFAKRTLWERSMALLNLYRAEKSNLIINAIDIELQPQIARANKIEKDNSLLIEYLERKMIIPLKNELNLTNALLKVLKNKTIKVYSTVGHNEVDLYNSEREGGSHLMDLMQTDSYHVESLNIQKDGIPRDTYALMILGPRQPFFDTELKQLRQFLEQGGKLLITLGPEFNGNIHASLIALIAEYGLIFNNDIVVDTLAQNFNSDATIPFINDYDQEHPITKNFKDKTVFPLTSSLLKNERVKDAQVFLLAKSQNFPASWAETDLKAVAAGKAQFDARDRRGPQAVMGALTKGETKIAAFGNSAFLINGYHSMSANYNLFLNTLSWLLDDEKLISFNRPGLQNQVILLSAGQVQLIFYFSVIVVPILLAGIALFMYKRMNNL